MFRRRNLRLFWLLYPSYLAIAGLALVALALASSVIGHRLYLDEVRGGTLARAEILRRPVAEMLQASRREELDRWCKELGRNTDTRVTVIDMAGVPVADSEAVPSAMDNHRERPEVAAALRGQTGYSRRVSQTVHRDMIYVAVPLLSPDGHPLGVVRAARPVRSLQQALQHSYLRTAQGLLLAAAGVAAVSFLLTRWLARPLRQMQEAAARFARGDLSARLHVSHSREIDSLATALDAMALQLGERFHTITQQRQEMEAILASMAEGVIAVGPDRRVLSLNEAAARMLAVKREDTTGRLLLEVVRNPALHQVVERALSAGAPAEGDATLRGESGEIDVQVRGTVLTDASGGRAGAVVVLNDVSRLRRLENLRREFAANVSHELRTPITSIRGFVETLQDGALDDPPTARRFLDILAAQAERLNAIVEDLLLLARVEKDQEGCTLAKEPCELRGILQAAILSCSAKAADRGVELALDCAPDLQVTAAPVLLQQAVHNLLDNAITYSPRGGRVEVRGSRRESGSAVTVQDWGCGIAPEHQSRIFERFYRVDKARSRDLGGTGLGLAIVKHIVQAHGGRVTVDSAPGQGSTFTLALPATLA